MSDLQRHIGRILNTGSTVVVVMPEIKGKEDHALIVETDALPPKYGDGFADLMNTEAQRTSDLVGLLGRRRFGTNEVMINALHANGYLKAMPQERITMLVTKHNAMPLKDIVVEMRKIRGEAVNPTVEPQDLRPMVEDLIRPDPTPVVAPVEDAGPLSHVPSLDALVSEITTDADAPDVPSALEGAIAELAKAVATLTTKLDESNQPKKKGRPAKKVD